MSLNVAYSYCSNLKEKEKLKIDKQVRKNRFVLRWIILLPSVPNSVSAMPLDPVEGFSPQQIVRNGRDRADSAEKSAPLSQTSLTLDDLSNLNDLSCIFDGVNGFQPQPVNSSSKPKYGRLKVNQYKLPGLPKPNPIPHARVTHKLKATEDNPSSPNSNRGNELVNERFNRFSDKMKEKYPDFKIDRERFGALAYDPQTKKISRDTIYEAEGALELEAKGLVSNIRRPDNPEVGLDFQGKGRGLFEGREFYDSKRPVSNETLQSRNAKPQSQEKMGLNIGRKSVDQQNDNINDVAGGPTSSDQIMTFVQLDDMQTPEAKNLMIDSILRGVEEKNGDPSTFYFLHMDKE